MPKSNDLMATIEYARRLHGHVGPYLVIGLKMGNAAKKALSITDQEQTHLTANVKVPLQPPFSCLLDGIQISTTCTIGNQRLQFQNSDLIEAIFSKQQDAKTSKITLKPSFSEQLEQKLKNNKLDEAYAWEIAELPDCQLFKIIVK